jgi:hypothetical protein
MMQRKQSTAAYGKYAILLQNFQRDNAHVPNFAKRQPQVPRDLFKPISASTMTGYGSPAARDTSTA